MVDWYWRMHYCQQRIKLKYVQTQVAIRKPTHAKFRKDDSEIKTRGPIIRKTCPCNVYLFEPHFYIAKLGYAGVYLFFLFLLQNIDCGYSLEPPRQGGSNVRPQTMFWAKIRKISFFFLMKFSFFLLKKSLYIAWASFRNVVVISPTWDLVFDKWAMAKVMLVKIKSNWLDLEHIILLKI